MKIESHALPLVPSGKKIYFLSDIHLGARYFPDRRAHEAMVAGFLDSICADAEALVLDGDILDYWYEYRTVVPRGYIRFFGSLARLADAGVKIFWLTGNHDIWLFDYLRDEIGLTVIDGNLGLTVGDKKLLITHGDAIGKIDKGYAMLRSIFRCRFCQWLYASVHPRWTVGFAHNWSKSSRKAAEGGSKEFEGKMRENVMEAAEIFFSEHPDYDFLVLGHHHVVVDMEIVQKKRLIILGDWIEHFTYGELQDGRFTLKKWPNSEKK